MRAIVSGAGGLLGYAAATRLLREGYHVAGIDNDQRAKFFGPSASTASMVHELVKNPHYVPCKIDIRNAEAVEEVFKGGADLIVHAAAQPSHDYAATHIQEDAAINFTGTLNMAEAWRKFCPKAVFAHISTSKVFGDNPNRLPLEKIGNRLDLPKSHPLWNGIPEDFSTHDCIRSFFGVSKFAGDLLMQEYGRNFGMPVGVWRPGCVTGSRHQGTEAHGFLSHLSKTIKAGKTYKIIGYDGLQLRCNIHADDLVDAILAFANKPKPGEVYCMGGRGLECSVLEAIAECEKRTGKKAVTEYVPTPRTGDHRWFIGDSRKFRKEFDWKPKKLLPEILDELCA